MSVDESFDSIPAQDFDWHGSLITNKAGGAISIVANAITILANDHRWAGVLAYDAFGEAVVARKPPPWYDDDSPHTRAHGDWADGDDVRLAAWFARAYAMKLSARAVREAVVVAAERVVIHPVREWLESLRWDAGRRVDSLFARYFGADDNDYTRQVSRMFMIGAIARAVTPGAKVDTMPILEGNQGAGKSSAIRALAGDTWFLETNSELGTKDSYQQLRRKWIVELAEIDSLSRSEESRAKAFISAQVDTYRPSYGRSARDFPRQCTFVGSTNAAAYLKDPTGARRYLPVQCTAVDVAAIRADRAQLWAEALALFQSGERWHVTDAEVARLFADEQERRFQVDPWEPVVGAWLMHPAAPARRRAGITTGDVLGDCLGIERGKWTRADEMRVGATLRRLMWDPSLHPVHLADGSRARVYRPRAAKAVPEDVPTVTNGIHYEAAPPAQPALPIHEREDII